MSISTNSIADPVRIQLDIATYSAQVQGLGGIVFGDLRNPEFTAQAGAERTRLPGVSFVSPSLPCAPVGECGPGDTINPSHTVQFNALPVLTNTFRPGTPGEAFLSGTLEFVLPDLTIPLANPWPLFTFLGIPASYSGQLRFFTTRDATVPFLAADVFGRGIAQFDIAFGGVFQGGQFIKLGDDVITSGNLHVGINPDPVPEPATLLLISSGLLALSRRLTGRRPSRL